MSDQCQTVGVPESATRIIDSTTKARVPWTKIYGSEPASVQRSAPSALTDAYAMATSRKNVFGIQVLDCLLGTLASGRLVPPCRVATTTGRDSTMPSTTATGGRLRKTMPRTRTTGTLITATPM